MFYILYDFVLTVYLCISTFFVALVIGPALQNMHVYQFYWIELNYQYIQGKITFFSIFYFNKYKFRKTLLPDVTLITSALRVVVCGLLLEEFSPISCVVSAICLTNDVCQHSNNDELKGTELNWITITVRIIIPKWQG